MADTSFLRTSFNAGELVDWMQSRVDHAKYHNGCSVLENFLLYPHGGAKSRGGVRYIAPGKYQDSRVRLIKFIYSADQAYVLEFGDEYIRFIMDRGYILDGADPYEITSPYSIDELRDLQVTRSSDVLYITHHDHHPKKLSRYSHTSWTLTDLDITDGPYREENVDGEVFVSVSATSGSGVTLSAKNIGTLTDGGSTDGTASTDVGVFSSTLPYAGFRFQVPAASDVTLREVTISVNVAAASTPGTITAYLYSTASDTDGSSDSLLATSSTTDMTTGSTGDKTFEFDYDLDKNTRYWIVFGVDVTDDATMLATVSHDSNFASSRGPSSLGMPDNLYLEWKCSVMYQTVSRPADLFNSGHVGALWRLKHSGDSVKKRFGATGEESEIMKIRGRLIVNLTPDAEDGWDGQIVLQKSPNKYSWQTVGSFFYSTKQDFFESADNQYYRLYCKDYTSGSASVVMTQDEYWGTVRITSVSSGSSATADVLFDIKSTEYTTSWAEGAWSPYRGYPTSVCFHEDRLVFTRDQYLWTSWVDDYENFTVGDTANAPISWLISVLDSPIVWVDSHTTGLVLGTLGDEIRILQETGKHLSATEAPAIRRQTARGSATSVPHLMCGPAVIFCGRDRRKIYELAYSIDVDAYKAPDLCQLAEHILMEGVVDMEFQANPDPTIWVVCGDGKMAALLYNRAEEVVGWSSFITDGEVESICCIPSSLSGEPGADDLYMSIVRTVNGEVKRYIGVLENLDALRCSKTQTSPADFFCLDAGLTYDGGDDTSSIITGLEHLEGETVSALADGIVVEDMIVSGGSVTLPFEASLVHVGVPYTCTLTPTVFEIASDSGSSVGATKSLGKISIYYHKTLGGEIGASVDRTKPVPEWRPTAQVLGQAAALKRGVYSWLPTGSSSDTVSVSIVQRQPLPMSILLLNAEVAVGKV